MSFAPFCFYLLHFVSCCLEFAFVSYVYKCGFSRILEVAVRVCEIKTKEAKQNKGAVVVHEKHTSASLCAGDGQRAAPGQLEGIMNRVVPEACAPRPFRHRALSWGGFPLFQGWSRPDDTQRLAPCDAESEGQTTGGSRMISSLFFSDF